MWFTGIYHHHIATKLNIHQGPLYGEVIRIKTKVPKALQITKTEKRVADGTPYRFYANETTAYYFRVFGLDIITLNCYINNSNVELDFM